MEAFNAHLQPFLTWLLRATVQAAVLVCLILLIQAVLGRKLGVRWRYCLWLVLLVRMALPWAPQSRVSLFNLLPASLSAQQQIPVTQEPIHAAPDMPVSAQSSGAKLEDQAAAVVVSSTAEGSEPATLGAPEMSRMPPAGRTLGMAALVALLPLVWLAGAFVLAAYVVISNIRLWRVVSYERPLTDQPTLDLLDCIVSPYLAHISPWIEIPGLENVADVLVQPTPPLTCIAQSSVSASTFQNGCSLRRSTWIRYPAAQAIRIAVARARPDALVATPEHGAAHLGGAVLE